MHGTLLGNAIKGFSVDMHLSSAALINTIYIFMNQINVAD